MKIAKYQDKEVTIIRTGGKNTRVKYNGLGDLPSFKVNNGELTDIQDCGAPEAKSMPTDDPQPETISLEAAQAELGEEQWSQDHYEEDIPTEVDEFMSVGQ